MKTLIGTSCCRAPRAAAAGRLVVGAALMLSVAAISGCGLFGARPTPVAPATLTPATAPTIAATVAVVPTSVAMPAPSATVPPTATKPPAAGLPPASLTATAFAPTVEAGQATALAGAAAIARSAQATATAYRSAQPPAGRYPADQRLLPAWTDHPRGFMGITAHNFLGWATAPAVETDIAVQEFGPVFMGNCTTDGAYLLWRRDTQKVYFLPRNSHGGLHAESCIDLWAEQADTWASGQPNNGDLTAPASKVVPRTGIGKVWREKYYGVSAPPNLDFALGPEQAGKAVVQTFERGVILQRADNKHYYVLFNTYNYPTRSGERTERVWVDMAP